MKVTFSARHFEASEKLQQFAVSELNRLDKYFDGALSGEVVLEENANLKAAEMRLNMLGKVLPVRMEGSDFYKIIPRAVDKLEKQLKSQKSKLQSR